MKLSIIHPGVYTHTEAFQQVTLNTHLGIYLAGLDYLRIFGADEKMLGSFDPGIAHLSLLPPGMRLDFRFNRKRENWVIQCRIPELRLAPGEGGSILEYDGAAIRLPLFVTLPMEQALLCRERFVAVRELWLKGTPVDRFAAEQLAGGLLPELLRKEHPAENESAVAKFRRLIDEDVHFQKTLAELSRGAGASPGYLRRLFLRDYLIDPGEYRARRRLGRIMTLIDGSHLSIKEIAEEVGMRHVTHLHLFLKERCGTTPRELLRQHRGE